MYEQVLRIARETVRRHASDQPFITVAGVIGPTDQALREATLAASLGYDLALVSPRRAQRLAGRRPDRARRADHRRDPGDGLLSPTQRRRTAPWLLLLAPAGGDRGRGRDQDRSVQPLPDDRRRARRRRVVPPRRDRPLHRQRRQHPPRPADDLPVHGERHTRPRSGSSAACSAIGRSGRSRLSPNWRPVTRRWPPTTARRSRHC